MDFSIVTDTAGARVSELVDDLMSFLEDDLNIHYKNDNVNIGFAIRCLPDSYNRQSFVRYTQKDNYLTIDFCVSLEKYEKLYKIEQQFKLGNFFLEWLDKGLSNKNFTKNNPIFDTEGFKNKIIDLGRKNGWFADEVDYNQELEF